MISQINDLIKANNFDAAMKSLDEEIEKNNLTRYKVLKAELLYKKQNYQECLDYSSQLLMSCNEYISKAKLLHTLILTSIEIGEIASITKYFECLDEIVEKYQLDDELLIAVYSLKGHYYTYRGSLDDAINYYSSALELARKLNDQELIGHSINNLAHVYRLKGEIQESLNLSKRNINFKLSNESKMYNFMNIGIIQLTRRDYSGAVLNFKDAFRLAEKDNNRNLKSQIYFNLIRGYIRQNRIDKAEDTLQKLTVLDLFDNQVHELRCTLANALILASSSRLTNKIKAQEILEKIIKDDIIDFELSIVSIKQLIEILIIELKLYEEEEVFKELYELILAMNSIANRQGAIINIIESLLYLSKLYYVNEKVDLAVQFADEAISISSKNNIKHLEVLSTKEKESLLHEIQYQKDITLKHSNLFDKMLEVDIGDYLNKISKELYSD